MDNPEVKKHLVGIRQHLDYLTKSPGERTTRETINICDCIIYLAEEIKKELLQPYEMDDQHKSGMTN